MTQPRSFNRRELLRASLASSLMAAGPAAWGSSSPRIANAVAEENQQPGTRDWLLSKTRIDPTTKYRCPWVEGYCSHPTATAGDTVRFYVSTNPASSCRIDIFRLGFYAGAGGRLVRALPARRCAPQSDPAVGTQRLRYCEWEPFAEVTIPQDWLSGVYVAKLTEQREQLQSYITFVVRDDRPVDLLCQCSDFTWQAYNRWPNQFSLYDDGENPWYWGGGVSVSFRRPYGKYCQILDQPLSIGSGDFFLWEFPFLYWLESQAYDVSYASNVDLHLRGAQLRRARGFLSVGHDEYWTIEMYEHVRNAIASGTSVGFFSGNAVCGRILYDDATQSFQRVGVFGPPGGTREFAAMSSLPHERPYANELIGAHSTGPVTGGADWICTSPEHWIYADSGMRAGDSIPGLIGWEWHGDPAPIDGLEVVATGPAQDRPGHPNGGQYTATVYPGPQGNFVFNAATCWWADGLSSPPGYIRPQVYTAPQGPDSRVRQITHNVLRRMLHV